jgi:hypothetical protein
MADPLTLAVAGAAVASIAGGVLGAVGQADAATAAAKQAELERLQLESEKDLSELQSVQEEVVRREELRRALSAQAAIAGGSGLATDSRSFLAAESNARRLAERDAQSNRLAIGSEAAKARGKNALSQGTLGAAGSIIGGVGGAFSSFAGSGLLGAAPGGAPGGKTLFARTGVRNSSGQI